VIVVGASDTVTNTATVGDSLLPLVAVQLQLTLHAVVLYGRVCHVDDIRHAPCRFRQCRVMRFALSMFRSVCISDSDVVVAAAAVDAAAACAR
jgi:hypothetical protein